MDRRVATVVGVALTFLALAREAPAQSANLESGWHIVRPGETLEALAERYLGSSRFWERLAQLNPGISNPDVIEPGQRLRVLVPRRAALPVARIETVSRKVEAHPEPNPWSDAQTGDLLVERDAVRTYQRSSTVMEFRDGTSLTVTEDSLVYLRRAGSRLQGVPSHSVEIVEGQADVALAPGRAEAVAASDRPEIEIVVGTARARSRPSPSGPAQTRARKAEGGATKLMVYEGEGDVEAGGAKVQVPRGMGTSVEPEKPPAPPEPLLPAPRLAEPAADAQAACAKPVFSWEPVPEAASYAVEICRDPDCSALVERVTGSTETSWRAADLPSGDYHWRVTARARSGLDGYPSGTRKVSIRAESADRGAPTAAIRLDGPQIRIGDVTVYAPKVRLTVETADEASGVADWTPRVDGREVSASALSGPWTDGEHRVDAAVLDRCGNRGDVVPVAFRVDAQPPRVLWEVKDEDDLIREKRSFQSLSPRRPRKRDEERGLSWTPSQAEARLRWHDGWNFAPAGTVHETVEIRSDLPQIHLTVDGVGLRGDGGALPLGAGRLLRVAAEDTGSSVVRLTLRTRTTEAGPVLEAEAEDGVGNTSTLEWLMVKTAAP